MYAHGLQAAWKLPVDLPCWSPRQPDPKPALSPIIRRRSSCLFIILCCQPQAKSVGLARSPF